jgi:hypothetical protein
MKGAVEAGGDGSSSEKKKGMLAQINGNKRRNKRTGNT